MVMDTALCRVVVAVLLFSSHEQKERNRSLYLRTRQYTGILVICFALIVQNLLQSLISILVCVAKTMSYSTFPLSAMSVLLRIKCAQPV